MDKHISVIGLSGRFPGCNSVEEFWRLLNSREEGLTRFNKPIQREELNSASAGSHFIPVYGTINDIERFDAEFFRWSPAEALRTDPQHRLLLEQSYMALHSAGYVNRKDLKCGVFASCSRNTYLRNILPRSLGEFERQEIEEQLANEKDHLATKISYRLGLNGPAVNVQCGCSSSLVATHLACQSLRAGECDVCIVGAATVRAPAGRGYCFVPSGIASIDGHCRPFDRDSTGTVPADGVIAVVLRRLEDSVNDRDDVLATILGSAINNDGSGKVGYSAPSVNGQRQVLSEAYDASGVDSSSVTYVEAHGTGTQLGDPIEVRALKHLFAKNSAPPCALSSVKSRIGHLDAASGLAGLATAVMALRNRRIPGCLHFQNPNPELDLEETRFTVSSETVDWIAEEGSRVAGVSSFGMGGTNCHMIFSEGPRREASSNKRLQEPRSIFLGARNAEAAARYVSDMHLYLDSSEDVTVDEIADTLIQSPRELEFRHVLRGSSREEVLDQLRSPISFTEAKMDRECVFLFPGQDASKLPGVEQAYRQLPAFRDELDKLCGLFGEAFGSELKSLLREEVDFGTPPFLDFLQPAIFTYCAAVHRALFEAGARPRRLLGHSLGELTALYVSGAISDEAATHAVALRSRLMLESPCGRTIAVIASQSQLRSLLDSGLRFSIAAQNGSDRYTLSGAPADLDEVSASLGAMGAASVTISDRFAFHSPLLSKAAEKFAIAMASIAMKAPKIPIMSCFTLCDIDEESIKSADYWRSTLTEPVQFELGLLGTIGASTILDVSPRQSLSQIAKRIVNNGKKNATTVMAFGFSKDPSDETIRSAVEGLWEQGCKIERRHGGRRRAIPSPPFHGASHWPRASDDCQVQRSPAQPFFLFAPIPFARRPKEEAENLTKTLVVGPSHLRARFEGISESLFFPTKSKDGTRKSFDPTNDSGLSETLITRLVLLLDETDIVNEEWRYCAEMLGTIRSFLAAIPSISSTSVIDWNTNPHRKSTRLNGINGLLRVLAQEDASRRYRTLSTTGTPDENMVVLSDFLNAGAPPDSIGLHGILHQLKVTPIDVPNVGRSFVKQNGVYIVAGAGKIGQALISFLIERGAKVLVLGRGSSQPNNENLLWCKIDWKRPACVANAIDRARDAWGPITGVFHTCGVTHGSSITNSRNLLDEHFHSQYSAKIDTFRILDGALGDQEAEFILTFSSLAALLGGANFGAYAAANAALNELVATNMTGGSCTRKISVCWDGWLLGGSEEPSALGSSVRDASFTWENGLAAIETIVSSNLHGVFAASRGNLTSRYEKWVNQVTPTETRPTPPVASPSDEKSLRARLAGIWKKYIGVHEITDDCHFLELGGDSLAALRVLSDTQQISGVEIGLREFYSNLRFGDFENMIALRNIDG